MLTEQYGTEYGKDNWMAIMTIPMGYRLCFLVLFVLFSSTLDYIFTIRHIGLGLRELNPVMDYLFTLGERRAFLFKYFMTTAGLFLLCSLSKYVQVNGLLAGIAVFYSALTLYHVCLFCLV